MRANRWRHGNGRGDSGRSRYNLAMRLRMTGAAVGGMLVLMAVVLLEASCTMYGEHPEKGFADATGGEGLERVFWKSVATANWTAVERVLASNYAGETAGATLDRDGALAQYRQWQLKEYSLGDVKTELNGSTIVVTYSITLSGSAGGAALPAGPQHMMSVWQQQKSGWVEIAHSASLP